MTKIESRIAMLEATLKNDADVLDAAQTAELQRAIARLRGVVEFERKNEADRVARIVATDAIIAEDVETGNVEVGTLAARVEARMQQESPKVAAENARRAKSGKPKMTAEEARKFEMYSERNANTAEAACDNGCQAYEDIFTFNRWIAQGMVVRKGEKATKIEVPQFREIVDEKTGEKKRIRVGVRMVPVFCRCQVKRLQPKTSAA